MALVSLSMTKLIAAIVIAIIASSAITIGASSILVNTIQGPQGDTGPTGPTGPTGAPGVDGATWYSGEGIPTASLGADGDYYFNTATSHIYNKIAGTWTIIAHLKGQRGPTGAYGQDGTDGATWHNGEGVPDSSLGVDGDYYLNIKTSDVYNKSSGIWIVIANIKGATGEIGPMGATGAKGDTGATGASGVDGATWYSASGVPDSSIGVNGDYYFNSATSDVYKRNSGTWTFITNLKGDTGVTGATGSDGSDGATWYSDSGAPDSSIGGNGDYYFDTTTSNIYNKSSGTWTIIANIKGATGEQGPYSPDYDSDWRDITLVQGQNITLTHDLNSTDTIIDITGKITQNGNSHQRTGLTGYTPSWSKTYGGTGTDYGWSVVQTSDGGYAIAGQSNSAGTHGGSDVFLVRLDANGVVLWQNWYGGTNDEYGYSVVQTSDGGFAIAGKLVTYTNLDLFLVKTTADGNQSWAKTYDATNIDVGYSVVQTSDGGYAIAGHSWSSTTGYDVFLVKTDSDGNQSWAKTYGVTDNDVGYSVVQTSDGGYAIAGQSFSDTTYYDVFLVKTDSDGNQSWAKTYGGTYIDIGRSVVQTNDGGYAIAGQSNSEGTHGSWDVFLVKTNADGAQSWAKTYGGTNNDYGYSVVQTSDGGFAITGESNSEGTHGYNDVFLVKTTADGTQSWANWYGGTGSDNGRSVVQTSDGGYAIAGQSGYDVFLVKTAVGEGLVCVESSANSVTLYRGATDPYWNYVRVRIWKIP